jgi:hypothetical protein
MPWCSRFFRRSLCACNFARTSYIVDWVNRMGIFQTPRGGAAGMPQLRHRRASYCVDSSGQGQNLQNSRYMIIPCLGNHFKTSILTSKVIAPRVLLPHERGKIRTDTLNKESAPARPCSGSADTCELRATTIRYWESCGFVGRRETTGLYHKECLRCFLHYLVPTLDGEKAQAHYLSCLRAT